MSIDQKTAKRLNTLAREQMKHKLLNDILIDLTICDLEGWGKMEYLNDLYEMLRDITRKHLTK